MRVFCNDCKAIFSEDEADEMEIDFEFMNGVGGLFPDHHSGKCLICPECGSDDLEDYPEEEEEEE